MTSNVYIAKNVYGGDGLGRLGDGRVVFVPGAWAGEQVRAEIVEEKKNFVKTRLVEVVEASPDRIDQSQVGEVPGMVYAGLKYEAEIKAKDGQLREFFDRARIPVEGELAVRCGSELNYRNKVVYHFAEQGGKWVVGYRREPSHEIVDIAEDPLARPEINAKLGEIRRAVTLLLTTGPMAVRRSTAEKGKVTVRWTKKTGVKWWIGEPPKDLVLKETTGGIDFEVPAGGFYQVNPEVGDELVKAVIAEVCDHPETKRVLDLYCGVGVFGVCALKTRPEMPLIGIESGRQAIDFARRNAANLGQVSFFAEEVGRNTKRIPISADTFVIVDPPRGGLEKGVATWLARSCAPVIAYVSCDPATLMRDLREITKGYAVEKVRWFNMFPRTARFETMVILRKV